MIENMNAKITEMIRDHIDEELQQYNPFLEKIFDIDDETSRLILISFINLILCRGKIMLRKGVPDYGYRKY